MKWGLENKIQTGFGVALLILVTVGALSYRSMNRLITASNWVLHTHEVMAELEATLNALDRTESGQRSYLVTGDNQYLADYEAGSAGVYAHVERVKDLTEDNPNQQRRIVALKPRIEERLAIFKGAIEARRAQGFEAAKQIVSSGRGKLQIVEIQRIITEMEHEEGTLLARRVKEDEASARNTIWTIGIFILLAFALLGIGAYLINRDFARRRRAEATLQEQASLLDLAHDTITVRKMDGTITFWNRGAEEMYGWTRKEALGKNLYALLQTQFPKPVKEIEGDLFREGRWEGELIHVSRDGRRVTTASRWALQNDALGHHIAILEINNDITARKRTEEALKESEQRLSLALESAQLGMWELDLANDTSVRSLRHDQIFGYSSLLSKWGQENFLSHVVPEDRDLVKNKFEEAFRTSLLSMECRINRADDQSLRWIAAQGCVYRDNEGLPARMMGVVSDITERKQAEEGLRRLNEDLERRTVELETSNKELEAFTYSVSHDLRAPLRHIDGFSKLLEEQHTAALPEEAREYVTLIRESTREMGHLVDDLLNLAQVGRKELTLQVTGLNSVVDEVVAELKRADTDRKIEWKVQKLPFVECDPGLIKQVFANLLSNAVKFTRPREQAVIEVGTIDRDGHSTIFVRDNGVGFSMKHADKLFGVFQRLHRQEDFEGTGVGLATIQRIIHKHGGRVWAEAELNQGATFYFTFAPAKDTGPIAHAA